MMFGRIGRIKDNKKKTYSQMEMYREQTHILNAAACCGSNVQTIPSKKKNVVPVQLD